MLIRNDLDSLLIYSLHLYIQLKNWHIFVFLLVMIQQNTIYGLSSMSNLYLWIKHFLRHLSSSIERTITCSDD